MSAPDDTEEVKALKEIARNTAGIAAALWLLFGSARLDVAHSHEHRQANGRSMRRLAYLTLLSLIWSVAFAGVVGALDDLFGGRPNTLVGWALYGGAY